MEDQKIKGLIFNYDDEVVAFYSNKKMKKFFKESLNSKSKISESKGCLFGKSVIEEKWSKRKLSLRMQR